MIGDAITKLNKHTGDARSIAIVARKYICF